MRDGYWVTRTYEAGSVGEKIKFFVPGPRPERATRRTRSEVKKQEQNAYSAEKRLARALNANFGPGDLLVGLDYSDAGMARLLNYAAGLGDLGRAEPVRRQAGFAGPRPKPPEWAAHGKAPEEPRKHLGRAEPVRKAPEEPRKHWTELDGEERAARVRKAAERELRLVLRRVKRELEKEGIPMRYVAITSDMDGSTGETVRIHHHLVVPAQAREAFRRKWAALGGVDWSPLEEQDDYTAIAEYFIRQVRHVPDEKKYIPSRNLIRPQPRDRIAASGAELRVPRGGALLYRNEFRPGQPQYIRYVLPDGRRSPPAAESRREKGGGPGDVPIQAGDQREL